MQGDYFCSGLVISRDVFSHFCLKFWEGKLLQLEAYFEDCLDSTTGERWCMGPHRISAAQSLIGWVYDDMIEHSHVLHESSRAYHQTVGACGK